MNIALIGYGRMGHAVETEAVGRGHSIVLVADTAEQLAACEARLPQVDVAVEFSQPKAAGHNVDVCLNAGVPVVCGTTGWQSAYDAVAANCRACGGRLLTAANFSLGMNIMFALNERLAALMRGRCDYAASISETHHIHKLDAPSGTALVLRDQIAAVGGRAEGEVPIASVREGEVPGVHTVCYRSGIDTVSITHEAHNRRGLAVGAVLAAEWLVGAGPGVYTMKDVLGI